MRKYIAELFGTFALVFFGTGAVIINDLYGGALGHVGVAISFGLAVLCMIYTFGNISGCHINPAVTIAFAISGRFKWSNVLPYVAAQVAGALIASFVLKTLFPSHANLGVTAPVGTVWQSFVMEVILSFFLMLVIIHVATGSKEQGMFAGLAIGFTILLEAMVGGPVSGASMNPARSFAPAVVSGNFDSLWLYIAAPIVGMGLAIFVWKYLNPPNEHVAVV